MCAITISVSQFADEFLEEATRSRPQRKREDEGIEYYKSQIEELERTKPGSSFIKAWPERACVRRQGVLVPDNVSKRWILMPHAGQACDFRGCLGWTRRRLRGVPSVKYSSQHVDRAVHEAAQVISRDCNGRFFQIGKAQCRRRIMVNHKGGVFGSMAVKPVHRKGSSCHPGSTVCDKQALRNGTQRQVHPVPLAFTSRCTLEGRRNNSDDRSHRGGHRR